MKNYSNLGLFKSKGRLIFEPKNKYRSPFQRDRDRIIHSASFRRLKHKTQVFVNTEGDHYRTRITHSIEVAQIARSIAKYLNVNDDLAETLSLAHDLGHTPFGHAGEIALNECMSKYGGFDHNLQTLRIVMFLEHKYLKFKGLNLSIETLDGLIKHNGPYHEISKLNKIIGKKNFKGKLNFNKNTSLEAQISAISDDIAYNNHDIQDGIKANLFKLEDLIEIQFFKEIYKSYKSNIKKKEKNIIIYQIIRDSINLMVEDVINNTLLNIKDNKIKKVVMCSGKIYYDLIEEREKLKKDDVIFVRLEQLYPFPAKTLANILKKYKKAKFIWCQEEPKNMGAWNTVKNYIDRTLDMINFKDINIKFVGRSASSTTATGNANKHLAQQKEILEKILKY